LIHIFLFNKKARSTISGTGEIDPKKTKFENFLNPRSILLPSGLLLAHIEKQLDKNKRFS